jgi:hypothetical protein
MKTEELTGFQICWCAMMAIAVLALILDINVWRP